MTIYIIRLHRRSSNIAILRVRQKPCGGVSTLQTAEQTKLVNGMMISFWLVGLLYIYIYILIHGCFCTFPRIISQYKAQVPFGWTFLIIRSRTTRLATLPPCCRATAPTMAYTAPDMMGWKPEPCIFSGQRIINQLVGVQYNTIQGAATSNLLKSTPACSARQTHHFRLPPHNVAQSRVHRQLSQMFEGKQVAGLALRKVIQTPQSRVLEGLPPIGKGIGRCGGVVRRRGDDELRSFHYTDLPSYFFTQCQPALFFFLFLYHLQQQKQTLKKAAVTPTNATPHCYHGTYPKTPAGH